MTRTGTLIKWLAYFTALVITTVFNYAILGQLPISRPLLLPVAAVTAGLLEGSQFGAGFGLLAGLLLTAAGHQSLLCIPLLSALGWACGLLAQSALRRDFAGFSITATAVILLHALWQVLIPLLSRRHGFIPLVKAAGGELLWTLVFALPLYWVFRFCCRHYGRVSHG